MTKTCRNNTARSSAASPTLNATKTLSVMLIARIIANFSSFFSNYGEKLVRSPCAFGVTSVCTWLGSAGAGAGAEIGATVAGVIFMAGGVTASGLTFATCVSEEGIRSFLPTVSLAGSAMSLAAMSADVVVLNLCAILLSVSPFTIV